MRAQFRRTSGPWPSILGLAIVAPLLNPGAISAQGTPDGVGCIKELQVPMYTSVARRSPAGGTVRARITIGNSGKAEALSLDSKDPDLKQEVKLFLGPASFMANCAGRQVLLLFTFRLEGEPEPNPPVFVWFRGPNEFVIVSAPRSPAISSDNRP
jgi:hypothetical protein